MGLSPFHRNSECTCKRVKTVFQKPLLSNPDPRNFSIERAVQINDWCVVEVHYPDATNYEGRKIMVYRTTIEFLRSQHFLDPHFCDGPEHISPFARFEPTNSGWIAAVVLAETLG